MSTLDDLVTAALSRTGDLELDLSSSQPRLAGELPSRVCTALGDRLVKLNVPGHALSDLPPTFNALGRLRVLFLLGNMFEAIPCVLGSLASLFMLSFKSNRLAYLPEDCLPSCLGWLILTDNRIPRLPRSIGTLTHLRKLMLASNRLRELPDEISLCTSLELVRLSDNLLESLPAGFMRLPRLAWLALAGNPLCPSLPAASDMCMVPLASLVIGERLGDGASGTVHRAKFAAGTDTEVAVKIFKASSSDGRPEDEVVVALALAPHQHLIKTHGCFREAPSSDGKGALGLIMELVNGEILGRPPSFATVTRDTFSPDSPKLDVFKAYDIVSGVASALTHMHAQGVCHGDLYAHNILVSEKIQGSMKMYPKLGDLGAAWAPPPGLREAAEKIEVRALGCLLEDLLGRCSRSLVDTESAAPLESSTACTPPSHIDSCSEESVLSLLTTLMQRCLADDTVVRPTLAAAVAWLAHPDI